MYRDYLLRKYGYEVLEDTNGFILYRIAGTECNIGEIYVAPEGRRNGTATRMADQITELARSRGCNILSCQTQLTGNDDELSIKTILSYGFKVHSAHNNTITYYKEIP